MKKKISSQSIAAVQGFTAIVRCVAIVLKKIHQYRYRQIKHDRLNDKQIVLCLKVRRFECRKCKKVFSEKIKGIDRKKPA